jgi:hypothetical protein
MKKLDAVVKLNHSYSIDEYKLHQGVSQHVCTPQPRTEASEPFGKAPS